MFSGSVLLARLTEIDDTDLFRVFESIPPSEGSVPAGLAEGQTDPF